MKEFYEKNKSRIILISIILICLFFIWLLFLKPLINFKKNEKILLEAGKRYYEVDSTKLPTGSRIDQVFLQKLYDKDFISTDLRSSYGSKLCDSKNSWVKVRKENGIYKYYVYLKCGIFESRGIDSEGPKITLKGSQVMNVERGEKYNEPGVSTIIDNVDGNIDIKNVKIDSSKVDTSKNGTYEVTYKVVDSFRNETIVTRKVIVNQTLNNIIKKDTKSKNYYQGNSNDNYIQIDGILFKIVKINDDETVKVVTESPISYVDYNSIDEWLNDYFYSKLSENAKKYIVEKSKWCVDKIDNPEKVTECNKYGDKKTVGLLSADEINKSTGNVMNNNAWVNSNSMAKPIYYKDSEEKYKQADKKDIYGVAPTLNLIKNLEIVSGNGTSDNPYKFKGNSVSKAGTKVNTLKVGEYITYSGYKWRVIGANESGSTKIIMDDILNTNNDFTQAISLYNNDLYDPNKKDSLGYNIGNELSKYISRKKMVKEKLKVIKYKNNVSYTNNYSSKTYDVKTSEVSIFDLFSNYEGEGLHWFIESANSNAYMNTGNSVASIKIYSGSKFYVRLTANINKDIVIVKGKGTNKNPYNIS